MIGWRIVIVSLPLLMAGCASVPPESGPRTGFEAITTDQGGGGVQVESSVQPIDLQTAVSYLSNALLNSTAIGKHYPSVTLEEIKDRTGQNIDVVSIRSQIQTQLSNSGKIGSDMGYSYSDQQSSSSRAPKKKFAKRKSGSYRLLGAIYRMQSLDGSGSPEYRMTLSLLDANSGDLMWVEERTRILLGR
ncbi:penicillin-binding protein activator [Gammaproteobacteria bacterium]